MPPIITCAAALNPCFNVNGVDFLIESISSDLEFFNTCHRWLCSRFKSKEFATFDVLGFWKEKETMFPVLSRMAMDLISVQAPSIAFESAFSTSERVLSIRRTRLTPASLEMCMSLKDHLDAKERKQDKCPLETPLDFEDVFDDEVQRNEAISLSDEEIALDANASSEDTLSPGGPQYDYMMSSEAEDDY
nr:transposase [Tanacetum cinerariifolium]